MRVLLSAQSVSERDRKSRLILERLCENAAFKRAGAVCFYVPLPVEVDTRLMIERSLEVGKRVLVPLVDLENKELKLKEIRDLVKDLAPGTLGILEPVVATKEAELRDVECLLLPALAFDPKGRRLGRGGGYYDRLLAKLPAKVTKIGLAFSFQVLPQIPLEDHDRTVDLVLTEK